MSEKAGALLWNRRRVAIGSSTTVNTGLTQVNKAFGNSSINEPVLGDGVVPSRVQVIPMAPLDAWTGVTHEEPFLDTDGLVKVVFHVANEGSATINVLFWDPHTSIGPGQADTYEA